jgi:hypothetical protein
MDKKYTDTDILNLKRSALVLTKKKNPFYVWLASIQTGKSEVNDLETEVYLLPDYEEIHQMENWVKQNFDLIFQDQMNNWNIDEDLWVKNRTYQMFKEWFDYTLHTMVFDMEDGDIEKI